MTSRGAWLVLGLALLSGGAEAQSFKREELRVPAPGAGQRGLQVLFVKPDLPGRLPLIVITHGSGKPEDRKKTSPLQYLPVAVEFNRRGWAVAVVMRRGVGDSGGDYVQLTGPCERPNYELAAIAGASDLRASIAYLQRREDIDPSRLVALGASAGGLVVTALTIDPPKGLLAAISFAGGQRSVRDGKFCERGPDNLVATFKSLGKRSRIPMLWVYSENDSYFPSDFSQKFKEAFSAGGGKVELIQAPPFRSDGHVLILWGIPQWTPYIDEFLKQRELVQLEKPLPLPFVIAPPQQLSAHGRKLFEDFHYAPLHRALAISPTKGAIAWYGGRRTIEDAKKAALGDCANYASDCRIVVINDEAMPLPPLPDIAAPKQLNADGRSSFEKFLNSPHHRAFAVSPNGSYGWRAGHSTVEEASKLALEGCAKHAYDCRIVVINDKAMPPPPLPDIAPPKQLNADGRTSFEKFLNSPHHRAFAVSPNGSYGWRSGHSTVEEASKLALEGCAKHASDCVIVVVDDKAPP